MTVSTDIDKKIKLDMDIQEVVLKLVASIKMCDHRLCEQWIDEIKRLAPHIALGDIRYRDKILFDIAFESKIVSTIIVLLKNGFPFSGGVIKNASVDLFTNLLFYAINLDELNVFKNILTEAKIHIKNFDINAPLKSCGINPLQYAILCGRTNFVKLLLDAPDIKLNIHMPEKDYATLLELCLIKIPYKINGKEYFTAPNQTIAILVSQHIKESIENRKPILAVIGSRVKLRSLLSESEKLGYKDVAAVLNSSLALLDERLPKPKQNNLANVIQNGAERKSLAEINARKIAPPVALPAPFIKPDLKACDEKSKIESIISHLKFIADNYPPKDGKAVDRVLEHYVEIAARDLIRYSKELSNRDFDHLLAILKQPKRNLIEPLFQFVIETSKPKLLQELLDSGMVDVNAKLLNQYSPVAYATTRLHMNSSAYSIKGQENIVQVIWLLVRKGANLTVPYRPKIKSASVLCELAKAIRMSEMDFLTLPKEVQNNWKLLRQLMFDALRIDSRNYYYKNKELNIAATISSLEDLKPQNADRILVNGYAVEFEGFHQGLTGEEIINSYNSFIVNPKFKPYLIQIQNEILQKGGVPEEKLTNEAREILANPISANLFSFGRIERHNEMEETIKNGGVSVVPLLVSVGQNRWHAITYLFHQNLCLRVNCGATTGDKEKTTNGILLYKVIHQDVLFKKWKSRLLNSVDGTLHDKDLNTAFLKECCESPEYLYKIKKTPQRAGNCPWKSSEVAVHAIIFINLFKFFKERYPADKYGKDSKNQNEHNAMCFKLAEDYSTVWFNLFIVSDRLKNIEQCNDPDIKPYLLAEMYQRRNNNFEQSLYDFESSANAIGKPMSLTLTLNEGGFLKKLGIDLKELGEKRAIGMRR